MLLGRGCSLQKATISLRDARESRETSWGTRAVLRGHQTATRQPETIRVPTLVAPAANRGKRLVVARPWRARSTGRKTLLPYLSLAYLSVAPSSFASLSLSASAERATATLRAILLVVLNVTGLSELHALDLQTATREKALSAGVARSQQHASAGYATGPSRCPCGHG